MNFLNADIPETDSSDDDYAPPSVLPSSSSALSIHKKRSQPISEFDDDDDDDDEEEDGDEEDVDDEEDIDDDVDEHQAQLLTSSAGGAGPSSAGATGAPSTVGASSPVGAGLSLSMEAGPSSSMEVVASSSMDVCPPSSAGDGTSLSTRVVAGDGTEGAAPAKAKGGSGFLGVITSVANTSQKNHEAVDGASALSTAKGGDQEVVNGGGERVSKEELNEGENGEARKVAREDGNEPSVKTVEVVKESAVVEHIGDVVGGNEVQVVKKRRVETNQEKSEMDDIWAEMNQGAKKVGAKKEGVRDAAALLGWLGGSGTRTENKPFKVKLLGDLEKEVKEKEKTEQETRRKAEEKRPRFTGLEAVLDAVKDEKKAGVLTKTREVWKDFKSKDEEVEAELEAYKKDKNRYTDRVAFLERSDVRQWDYEQASKRTRRR